MISFPYVRRNWHEAEMARVLDERRKIGRALAEKSAECDALRTKLDRITAGLAKGAAASAAKRKKASA